MIRSYIYIGATFVVVLACYLISVPASAHDGNHYTLGSLHIDRPWARATPSGARAGAAYFIVRNLGATDDRLIGASSPTAAQADVHEMSMNGNVMHMAMVKGGLVIPAGGSITLQPSGYHIMLTGLKGPLVKGTRVPMTLTFEHAGSIDIQVEVEAIGAAGPASHGKPDTP